MERVRRFPRGVLLVLLLLVVVNLPLVHGAWIGRQVERNGVDVVATVVATRPSGDGGLVEFRFDEQIDPGQTTWPVALAERAFDTAEATDELAVRVVPGEPSRYRVPGAQGAGLLTGLTLFADVVLLLALVLLWRRRGGPLVLVAVEDVTRARPGGRLEQLSGTTYLVVGEVSGIEADAVLIDVGDRTVRVELGGHRNPVGYEQPAQVTARLPESGP